LRLLKGLIFFGKRELAPGINLPERSEIWKTLPASEFQQKARVEPSRRTPRGPRRCRWPMSRWCQSYQMTQFGCSFWHPRWCMMRV